MTSFEKITPAALALTVLLPFSQASAQQNSNDFSAVITGGASDASFSEYVPNLASLEACLIVSENASSLSSKFTSTCLENGEPVAFMSCERWGQNCETTSYEARP